MENGPPLDPELYNIRDLVILSILSYMIPLGMIRSSVKNAISVAELVPLKPFWRDTLGYRLAEYLLMFGKIERPADQL